MKVTRRLAAVATAAAAAMLIPQAPAYAHGERTQPSWTRTTTSTFFDLEYSGDAEVVQDEGEPTYVLDVGDVLELRGKVQISDKWPTALGSFSLGTIGVLMQGPVLALRNLEVNGVFTPGSIAMEPGDFFTFSADLVGRVPGRYHIHPRIDLKGKGPTVGPGIWVRVRGGSDYDREITLASGERIDVESFALGRVYGYHLFWIALAALFVGSLLWRKRLLSRLIAVRRGTPDRELFSTADRRVTAAVGVVTLLVIVGGYLYATNEWSTIPIQVRRQYVPELERPVLADGRVTEARYDQDQQSLTMALELTNEGDRPVDIERLVIGPVSAAAPGFMVDADEPLRLEPGASLAPGQTRAVQLTVGTEALEEHRLLFTNTAIAQIGGLLIVRDAGGERSWVSLVADLIDADAASMEVS